MQREESYVLWSTQTSLSTLNCNSRSECHLSSALCIEVDLVHRVELSVVPLSPLQCNVSSSGEVVWFLLPSVSIHHQLADSKLHSSKTTKVKPKCQNRLSINLWYEDTKENLEVWSSDPFLRQSILSSGK